MLGAIAKIYTVIIHCIDTNSVNVTCIRMQSVASSRLRQKLHHLSTQYTLDAGTGECKVNREV